MCVRASVLGNTLCLFKSSQRSTEFNNIVIIIFVDIDLSLPYVGLQHDPCCHGDSAQHWSGYFIRPLFYLRTAPRVGCPDQQLKYRFIGAFMRNLLLLSVPACPGDDRGGRRGGPVLVGTGSGRRM